MTRSQAVQSCSSKAVLSQAGKNPEIWVLTIFCCRGCQFYLLVGNLKLDLIRIFASHSGLWVLMIHQHTFFCQIRGVYHAKINFGGQRNMKFLISQNWDTWVNIGSIIAKIPKFCYLGQICPILGIYPEISILRSKLSHVLAKILKFGSWGWNAPFRGKTWNWGCKCRKYLI